MNKPPTRTSTTAKGAPGRSEAGVSTAPLPMPVADVVADSDQDSTQSALLQRALDELERRGQPQSAESLAQLVFGVAAHLGQTGQQWERLLDALLAGSPRFVRDATGMWGLARWQSEPERLADMEWAVIDVETTGLAPGRHRLIEVGAVLVRAGELAADYSRLINPERRIPQFITSFTGIRQTMVNRARRAQMVLPELRDFVGERVLVGHNISFDLGFLNFEAERLGLALRFGESWVDTLDLARHFLTGMRRARLDRVAAALHVPVRDRHRALGDARVTAQVFALLLARAIEAGCQTLADLRAVLAQTAPVWPAGLEARPTGSLYLNPAWRREFPAQPGVYLMKDEHGEVIYVGKAKCLRDRLASYYHQPLGYVRKLDGLIQSVRAIEVRVLGSELAALLEESRLIKALQPRYNVQLRNFEHYPFIKVDVQHAFPRIYATREVAADGARYFGPFRSGRIVDVVIELLHRVCAIRSCTRALPPQAPPTEPCLRYHLKRCPAPCRGDLAPTVTARYREAVEEACAFLGGDRDDLLDRLRREMFAASARQDFERAARLRDALREADQVLVGQRLIAGAVDANNLLVVYPSAIADQLEIFLVRHGRLIEQRSVAAAQEVLAHELAALLERARQLGPSPDRVERAEVDEINILARWIHRHIEEETRHFFPLPRDLTDSTLVAGFAQQTSAALLSNDAPPDEQTDEQAPEDAAATAHVPATGDALD